jgi:hypothetical protein
MLKLHVREFCIHFFLHGLQVTFGPEYSFIYIMQSKASRSVRSLGIHDSYAVYARKVLMLKLHSVWLRFPSFHTSTARPMECNFYCIYLFFNQTISRTS